VDEGGDGQDSEAESEQEGNGKGIRRPWSTTMMEGRSRQIITDTSATQQPQDSRRKTQPPADKMQFATLISATFLVGSV
jgi:hypothetical protein